MLFSLILKSSEKQTSFRSFSVLALLRSGQRSAAAPPSAHLSQNEKILENFVSFSSDFRISFREAPVFPLNRRGFGQKPPSLVRLAVLKGERPVGIFWGVYSFRRIIGTGLDEKGGSVLLH